ncbi:MAG TPA: carbohydrate porin [Acidovorax sp.]|nr:carbohydrate porin [Acidovorax sp.]
MHNHKITLRSLALLSLWAAFACGAQPALAGADTPDAETWNAKFQATYVWQDKRPFAAAYSGTNSLTPDREKSYSFTATAALGLRPWEGGELYFNPEVAQGVPLSGLTGLGGFTNGEIARSSGPILKLYRARLFLRQTWGQSGEREAVESDANQLAGSVAKRRWVLTAGNISVLDVFDGNAYSHDPRTQFLNWSLMTHGAYDFAADARGYTWGAALEWYHDDWVVRAGRFLQPKEPNQQALDARILRHYGDQIELEHAHRLGDQPGKLRLLAFRNRARMSRFQDALDLAARTGALPSIDDVRHGEQIKRGFGLNVEQAVSDDVGVFGRASWADGKTETYAYTEIDRSISGGVVVKGGAWGRAQDSAGFAMARNGLSKVRREYLAAGGLGFFIGDGRLNYRPEVVLETFYSLNLTRQTWLTLDWQHIRNPAYNADRGRVNVASVRLHAEF